MATELSTGFIREAEEDLLNIVEFLVRDIKRELIDQGHTLTGKLRDSIERILINANSNVYEAGIELEQYYEYVQRYLKPSDVPYQRGSGKKTSLLIDALTKYWMQRKGLSEEEAKGAAFGTAENWKKYGRPSPKSWEFSSNGRRLGFLTFTVGTSKHIENYPTEIEKAFENTMERRLDVMELNVA